ncbi:MAG: ABC transporter ATP-binding protein [Candidatus Moraniibacteriota bacterium]
MIELHGVSKSFVSNGERISILESVDLDLKKGEKVAIVGPSGSGKTTLLSLIAGLDIPDVGTITVAETVLSSLDESGMARFRNATIGIVFQSFELIAPFTAIENVRAPLDIAGKADGEQADDWLRSVGLDHRRSALPGTLSGGEKQRAAIARALVMRPAVVLADEPTGSLDRMTGGKVIDLLIAETEKTGATLVIITHDLSVAEKMDRVFELRDRKLHVLP